MKCRDWEIQWIIDNPQTNIDNSRLDEDLSKWNVNKKYNEYNLGLGNESALCIMCCKQSYRYFNFSVTMIALISICFQISNDPVFVAS